VGTYGEGIFVSRDGSGDEWERITSEGDDGISWDFVHAFAFAPGQVWYGTIGNGWGLSTDNGRSWRNWTFDELGPRWQYVAPDGIVALSGTTFIATADGLRITTDSGQSYREITDQNGLPNKYLLSLAVEPVSDGGPTIYVEHLHGISKSHDGGQTWIDAPAMPDLRSDPSPLEARIHAAQAQFRAFPSPGGAPVEAGEIDAFWFRRPIDPEDNAYIDQTYTYGSTMGGNFQQHQGIEFNDPEGTPVYAIGSGVVALAEKAEAGSNTVAILHDRRLDDAYVWSSYYHNVDLAVEAGDRVEAGDLIAHTGNTGRATNDHLHLEIHTTPTDDVSLVVNAEERYPRYTRNPQLWLEPLLGTGVIAGRVFDGNGQPMPGARVYGIMKERPRETPFSFAETYEDKAHSDPRFGEHFVIGDVPAGTHVIGVEIDGAGVYRAVEVVAGKVTLVELRP
jgi:hypothetical protein